MKQPKSRVANDEADSPSQFIVQRIAEATDREVTQLPPLYDTVDPDALDDLLSSIDNDNSSFSIKFSYAGQQVSIEAGGSVNCEQTQSTV